MERAVLDQLAVYFVKRLDGYPTTLREDEILVTIINFSIMQGTFIYIYIFFYAPVDIYYLHSLQIVT